MNNVKSLVIEALRNVGYEIFDGRFIKDLGFYITIAFNLDVKNADEIQIANGDWRGYYYNSYDKAILISDTDLEKALELI